MFLPWFFSLIVAINDLPHNLLVKYTIYADDTTIFVANRDLNHLANAIQDANKLITIN